MAVWMIINVPDQWPTGCKSVHFQKVATTGGEWTWCGHAVGSPGQPDEPDYCCCWRGIPAGVPRSDLHPQRTAAGPAENGGPVVLYHNRGVGRTEQTWRAQQSTYEIQLDSKNAGEGDSLNWDCCGGLACTNNLIKDIKLIMRKTEFSLLVGPSTTVPVHHVSP